ncbi:MAG: hypothetical protein GF329_12010 [Candidatus Lokiarchaeota archaeon]|nr:hypothetical protein [Candidatus Lokiarchaeota archaeon]
MEKVQARLESIVQKRKMFRVMRSEYIKKYIRDAHIYYDNYNIPDKIVYKAINLLSRFLYAIHPQWPQEKYGFYAAALYMVLHEPTEVGLKRYISKQEFTKRLDYIRLSNLEWSVNKIEEALEVYRLHDNHLRSFWLDEHALESNIITAVIKRKLNSKNEQYEQTEYSMLVEEVLDIIMQKLKLIPSQFRREFWNYLSRKVEIYSNLMDS